MIRRCEDHDFEVIWAIMNDGARAYKGVIPEDCWTEPYMSSKELQDEIEDVEELRGGLLLLRAWRLDEVDDQRRWRRRLVQKPRQRLDLVAGLELPDVVDVGQAE